MSSVTSTKHRAAATAPVPPADSGFRAWHFFVLASLLAATAAVMIAAHPSPANLVLTSFTIGAAGFAGYGFYRMLAPLALDEERPAAESLGGRARAGIEREKMLALRSIKELEFDRAMGKVSDQDFQEMSGRLRARAITLMKQLDDSGAGYRQLIEQELRTRVGRGAVARAAGSPSAPAADGAPAADAGEAPAAAPAAPTSAAAVAEAPEAVAFCPGCGAKVDDEDARFCKRCGRRLTDS